MNGSGAGGCCQSLALRRFLSHRWGPEGPTRTETKTKKAGAKGQGTSCLLTPAYAATDPPAAVPDCPSSRLPSCSFVACTASATAATPPPPSWAEVNREPSLTQREKYIAQSGARKKTVRTASYLRAAIATAVASCCFQTVGGDRLPSDHTSTKKLANFTPAPLALMPTEPAAAIALSLTCTSSSRRK